MDILQVIGFSKPPRMPGEAHIADVEFDLEELTAGEVVVDPEAVFAQMAGDEVSLEPETVAPQEQDVSADAEQAAHEVVAVGEQAPELEQERSREGEIADFVHGQTGDPTVTNLPDPPLQEESDAAGLTSALSGRQIDHQAEPEDVLDQPEMHVDFTIQAPAGETNKKAAKFADEWSRPSSAEFTFSRIVTKANAIGPHGARETESAFDAPPFPIADKKTGEINAMVQQSAVDLEIENLPRVGSDVAVTVEKPIKSAGVFVALDRISSPATLDTAPVFQSLARDAEFSLETGLRSSIPEVAVGQSTGIKAAVGIPSPQTPVVSLQNNPVVVQISKVVENAEAGDTIELRLDPAELGKVRINMSARDGIMHVTIAAERQETADLLRKNSDALDANLTEQGYSEAQLDFTDFDESETSDDLAKDPAEHDAGESSAAEPGTLTFVSSTEGLDLRL